MLPISSDSQVESPRVAPSLNREAWLEALAEKLRPDFESVGLPLPEIIHYAPGFPSKMALSRKKRRIGEHWHGRASKDGGHQIFISPLLTDDIEVAETLVHELLHAGLPAGSKHGPKFKAGMQKLGLEGKPTETHAGPQLRTRLEELVKELGAYPHAGLSAYVPEKKQTTRMRKVACEKHPGFIVRASSKVISQGLPPCGLCWKEYLGEEDAELPPVMVAEEGQEEDGE